MLKAHHLSYHLPSFSLSDISVGIPHNKKTAIMGLNGSGKTTLLKLFSGFFSPHSGEITLEEKSLTRYTPKLLAQKLSFVPQDFPTNFPYAVFEFVLMGRYPWQKGWFTNRCDKLLTCEILEQLDLTPFQNRILSELSGGERQRVLMARALNQKTQTLLLDEPLNHLDIKNKRFLLNLLDEQNRIGKTVISVIHDFDHVQNHFDHVILLKDGKLAFCGPPEDAFVPKWMEIVFEV